MQFFRKMLDPTVSTESTPIPQFKLAYRLSDTDFEQMNEARTERSAAFYYIRSEKYFQIKPNALAKDGNRNDEDLPISFRKSDAFKLETHAQIVKDHTKLYQDKYNALFNLDLKITGSLILAIAAMYTPFIPFVGLVAIAGWMATFYFLNQRADLYNDYHDSLILLSATCNWALGTAKHLDNPEDLAKAPVIKDMLDCLYAVLTKKQVQHLIDDQIEHFFQGSLDSYDSRFKFPLLSGLFSTPNRVAEEIDKELEKTALKQRGADLIRCAYGLNRGKGADFLRMLALAIPDLLRAGYNAGKAYFTRPAEEQGPAFSGPK